MHGEVHRRHRRMMQPSFSRPSVATMIAPMVPLVDQVIDRWQAGRPLDMLAEMRTLSNWVSANLLFGHEDFAASLRVGGMIDHLVALDTKRRSWGMVDLNLPGTPYHRELKHAEILEKTMLELVEQKRRWKTAGEDVLSMLIRAADSGSGMSDKDVIAHSIALYGASFETTASALTWTMFLIAQHPRCAARLLDEVSEGLGDWPPDLQKLDSLPFLDAVVCESMRLLPPVPMTFRRVTRQLELEGVQLDEGNKVALSAFLTHRDPAVFPHPDRFDPSRWLASRPDPYEYIPFSAGPRLCLGAFFAMAELKLVVARVVQKYRLTVVPGAKIDGVIHLVLKPKKELPMLACPQDRAFGRSLVGGNIGQLVDLASAETDPYAASPQNGVAASGTVSTKTAAGVE
ncbi:MAG: cytochrome P450 [Propylenella sp.]